MDVTSDCSPLLAGTDSQNNTTSSPNAASVTDADKVIKTKIDSTQVQEAKREEELLKGLLNDDYCHICEAVLLFESQRLSHYEGKKHAQKLKVYLQTRSAEKTSNESIGPQRRMTTNKDRICELCNMVFSSQVVAKSHYKGKIHLKNLRKQGLQPPVTERNVEEKADQKYVPEGGMEHHVDSAAISIVPNTEMDLKDPNKYCGLCAASFNNPQMALQHYNGRKHQRNQARQDLIKELRNDEKEASSLMCQMCNVQFNSVEMYQAHMQGNKHQVREKKVVDLCKTQQKVYSTFADELADYIQVQRARGITPKAGLVSHQTDSQKADMEDRKEEQKSNLGKNVTELTPQILSKSQPRYHSQPGFNYPVEAQPSQYQGQSRPSHRIVANFPHPVPPGSDFPCFAGRVLKKRRNRNQSNSSSHTSSSSSSYFSSYSSSSSDSDDNENRCRDRRKTTTSRKERCRNGRDAEQKQRKHHGKEKERDIEERRTEDSEESEKEKTRKKLKHHNKRRRKEKKSQEEKVEVVRESVMGNCRLKETMDSNERAEADIQAKMYVEQENDGQDGSAKTKYRKEKKKLKEKVDTRTEEEKLWDDSILGC